MAGRKEVGTPSPDNFGRRAREALDHFMECVEGEFTGTLQMEFQAGVPMMSRQTAVRRYAEAPGEVRLTRGR